jgi:phospholysine phosphohistidine inorganic pyrophosphate phosphatase
LFESALADIGIEAKDGLMVGDDIVSDVGGAQSCGLPGVLVRTGKYRPSDENHAKVKPDRIVDNLAQLVTELLTTKQS